jgi:hypothetical protein
LGAKSKLLFSEIALSRKQFGIGHVFIYTFLLRMADSTTSHNIDISSWDILHIGLLDAALREDNFPKRW